MAVRLSKVFGGSAESWLTQQAHYDLAQVHADRIKLKRLELTVSLSSKEKLTDRPQRGLRDVRSLLS
ncbi:MAG: hypothetical protein ABSF45_29905 [Terriglobia bacterium]|jgi:plasmid maintenance system antidote protein VapI